MINDDEVEDVLEQWELIKSGSHPKYKELCDAIENEFAKFEIDKLAGMLRLRRMAQDNNEVLAEEFVDIFNKFSKMIVYRILKEGN